MDMVETMVSRTCDSPPRDREPNTLNDSLAYSMFLELALDHGISYACEIARAFGVSEHELFPLFHRTVKEYPRLIP